MRTKRDLLVGEWAVLALLCERPAHGYAVAALMAPDGDVGRIWALSEQLTYRAIGTLRKQGLIEVSAVKAGRAAPSRTELTATRGARRMVSGWLRTPERRIRELRPNLLLKLHLLHRSGRSPLPLLRAQRALLADAVATLDAARADDVQPTALVNAWRRTMTAAALTFVEARIAEADEQAPPPRGR